ncbi:LysR family transcriptional regulator [Hyphococcus flavus]|uniref:LysR family transcriptional regulator n=1 Tax=Hyphococcus flavus TaxID=1866326 RepID=A0AAE9ZGA8_9PROT|nr:LysR family transcriptional regulator [Hyphococcus flavus]WDI32222.1 LysR family transcriptional regulator [Hyphococcus flavus]
MDVIQAKTFLAIVEGGNFLAAARRVHVTQSTVSARIKALEDQLGKPLFVRSKAGCALTPAGHQFHRYAQSMVRAWEEAKHQVAVPDGFDETLIVGGQYSLWNRLLLRWVPAFQSAAPRVALRCEIGMPQRLMREMTEGVIDLAVIYRPEHRPGVKVKELFEDRLILVTADPMLPVEENYIFIDWGDAFREAHALSFSHLHNPGLTLDLGALGVNLLISRKASGYFPERIVQPHIDSKLLTRVDDAPTFSYPAYVVYQENFSSPEVMLTALRLLEETAEQAVTGSLPPPFWT